MSEREFSIELLEQYIFDIMFNQYRGIGEFQISEFYRLYIKNYLVDYYVDTYSLFYAESLSVAISLNKVPNSILDEIREWSIANL
jgi:hypothetical protein